MAACLASILEREIIGLDRVVWQAGWMSTPREERLHAEEVIAGKKYWLLDGVSQTICQSADTVPFLDVPRHLSYWRVFKRNFPYMFRSRPGLPENCPEYAIVATLLRVIWNFPRRVRPKIIKVVQTEGDGKLVFHIQSEADLFGVV